MTTDELFGLAVTFGVTIGELLDPMGPDRTRRVSFDVGLGAVSGGPPRLLDPDVAQLWAASRVIVRLGDDVGCEYALDVTDLPVAAERKLAALRAGVGQ